MAHAAVTAGLARYDSTRYALRARLYAGLREGTKSMGPLAEDERTKMIRLQACAYCCQCKPKVAKVRPDSSPAPALSDSTAPEPAFRRLGTTENL